MQAGRPGRVKRLPCRLWHGIVLRGATILTTTRAAYISGAACRTCSARARYLGGTLTSTSDLRPLAFREGGSGDRVVIFVHGMYQSSIFWQPTLDDLPEGVRGFAVDLPGFCASSGLPGPYTIQGHAE